MFFCFNVIEFIWEEYNPTIYVNYLDYITTSFLISFCHNTTSYLMSFLTIYVKIIRHEYILNLHEKSTNTQYTKHRHHIIHIILDNFLFEMFSPPVLNFNWLYMHFINTRMRDGFYRLILEGGGFYYFTLALTNMKYWIELSKFGMV